MLCVMLEDCMVSYGDVVLCCYGALGCGVFYVVLCVMLHGAMVPYVAVCTTRCTV